ncbi:4Fe-4S binding protein [Nonomuraea muscovyensis]|uniref:4Fe-4S binding protein n=1 Tax=Nonomuraea muscovyensis TaxID=1124761 RepID=UPI0033C9A81D
MLRKSVTQQYPEVKPDLPPRSRGVIALVEENCTSCMLCARECPDWCIYIDSHKETLPAPEGGRPRQRNVLDRFAIDFALCMYCGICIEVCPFDALFWSPEFEYAEGDIRDLLHEKDRLTAWSATVPPPPAHDPGAEPPKELAAAPRRPARPDTGEPAARTSSTGTSSTGTSPDRPSGTTAERPRPAASSTTAGEPSTPGATEARRPAGPAGDRPPAGEQRPPGTTPQPTSGDAAPGPSSASDASVSGAPAAPGDLGDSGDSGAGGRTSRRPGAQDQGRAPGARAPREGRMANVRGIRPPGALPTPPSANEATTPSKRLSEGEPATEDAGRSAEAAGGSEPDRPAGDPAIPDSGDPAKKHPISETGDAGRRRLIPETGESAGTSVVSDRVPAGRTSTSTETGETSSSGEPARGAGESSAGHRASTGEAPSDEPIEAAEPAEAAPGSPAADEGSSTGRASSEEFSTAQGEPRPAPDPEGQTAAPSPRRRRMPDPRSIRPPGRLTPDETRESEEES